MRTTYILCAARRLVIPALTLICAGNLQSQTLSLFNVDPSNWPIVQGEVLAIGADGSPYQPSVSDLRVFENGIERPILSLDCPPPEPVDAISSVLTLDISGSMTTNDNENLTIAKAAARAWITTMPLGISECALTSFNKSSFLNEDFTIDSRRLLDAVDRLSGFDGTVYDAAFLSPVTGAIDVAKRGEHERVIVFLTDGNGQASEDLIVQQAEQYDITIHCVTVGLEAPDVLKNIAERTGGLWFENVETPEEAEAIYKMILGHAQGGRPCTITWESMPSCNLDRNVILQDEPRSVDAGAFYTAPQRALADITLSESEIEFGSVEPGTSSDVTIQLEAGDSPVEVRSVTSSHPQIQVVEGDAPPSYTIPANQSRDLTVRFSPTDSGFVFASIKIESSGCPKTIYVSGGERDIVRQAPDIRLTHPNGGERFPVGSDTALTWTGVLPSDTVMLEYSTNAGTTWSTITTNATGLRHPWNVPNTPSETCLARVSIEGDTIGTGERYVIEEIHRYREHRQYGRISGARISPDGNYCATASDGLTDQVRVWHTVTGAPYRTFTPAGSVVDLDFSRNGEYLMVAISNGRWQLYDIADGVKVGEAYWENISAVSIDSETEDRVIAGDTKGNVGVWTMSGGDPLTWYSALNGSISAIDYSSSFGEYVVGGSPDTLTILQLNGRVMNQLPSGVNPNQAHSLGITSARYSQDGARIISTANDGEPRVWDRQGREARMVLQGHGDGAISQDGSLMVTGAGSLLFSNGNDPDVARLWDGRTGELLGTLSGHLGAVTHVDIYSVNGTTYVLTGSTDSTAIVWSVRKADTGIVPGASDVSDNLWAIVTAGIVAPDIDFGRVSVGDDKDSVVVGYVTNTGGLDVTVTDIDITGTDAPAFSRMSGSLPFTLAPGERESIEFRFSPSAVRSFDASVIIESSVDTIAPTISGEGVEAQLAIETSIVDFGRVEISTMKDSTVSVVIRNIGSLPLDILDTKMLGPDMGSFEILGGAAPFTLQPGEGHAMDLRFAPTEIRHTTGSIGFEYNGSGSPAVVLLVGEGYCESSVRRASVLVDSISAAPGEQIDIPFAMENLDSPGPSPPSGPLVPIDFIVDLRVNKSLLSPVEQSTVQTIGLDHIITRHSGTWNPTTGQVIWTDSPPRFVAALGNREWDSVTVDSLQWLTACAPDVALIPGTFRIDELCRAGGTRLFDADGFLKLESPVPNPTNSTTEVRFELIEEGATQIFLVNARGQRIATLSNQTWTPGSYALQFNAGLLDQGSYWLVLMTPTTVLSRQFVVDQ